MNGCAWIMTGTVLIAAAFLVWFYFKQGRKNMINFLTTVLGVSVLTFALVSSYETLYRVPKLSDLASFLKSSVLAFLVLVFLKMLIMFWMIALAVGLFNPKRISEFGAKILGVEVSNKYTPEELDKTREEQEKAVQQLDIIADLNRSILEYISGPFEQSILVEADIPAAIRQTVKDILTRVYYNFPKIRIHVIPLTDLGFKQLDDRLASIIRLLTKEEVDIVTIERETIAIAILHGYDDLSSAIVIDTSETDYEISDAEICTASTLFVTVSTVIGWALKSTLDNNSEIEYNGVGGNQHVDTGIENGEPED